MKSHKARFLMAAIMFFLSLAAWSESYSLWFEAVSPVYGLCSESSRILTGLTIPILDERSALDARLFVEWSTLAGNRYAQAKFDALYRYFITGQSGYAMGGEMGDSNGLYLACGLGTGYGKLWGKETFAVLAIGPLVEFGYRLSPFAFPLIIEPYAGYSLAYGPRLGDVSGMGVSHSANLGLRLGIQFQ